MPAPYDYTINVQDPFTAGLKGYQMAQQQRTQAMAIEQQRQQMAAEEQKRIRQAEYQQAQAELAQNPNATAQDYIRLQGMYPEKAQAIKDMNSQRSEAQLQGDLNIMQKVNTAMAAGKNDVAIDYLNIYSTALKNSGREDQAQSINNIIEMAKEHPEAVKSELYQQLLANWGPEKFSQYYDQQQRLTVGGKAQPVGGGIIIEDPDTGEKKLVTGSFRNGELTLAGTELPGTILSRFGESPEEQQKREVKTTQEKTQATSAEKTRQEFFGQYEKIQNNIRTLDEGIALIEKGMAEGKDLGVGPIRRYFPTWGSTANQLKNVANRMGLNVVSSVTFGALSESELKMAMQTAMPTTLRGQALLDWMKSRKAAQEKLADYLSQAASFIGSEKESGGVNTPSDWMQVVQSRKKQPVETRPLKSLSPEERIRMLQGQ
jgi:hypothetical protein